MDSQSLNERRLAVAGHRRLSCQRPNLIQVISIAFSHILSRLEISFPAFARQAAGGLLGLGAGFLRLGQQPQVFNLLGDLPGDQSHQFGFILCPGPLGVTLDLNRPN